MPKLKNLSGNDLIKIFQEFGFEVVSQKGSHVKLKKYSETSGDAQVMIIPKHKEMDKGTLKGIYSQALKYVPDNELRIYFYSD